MSKSGICSITIDGQKIKLRFGMPACRAFSEMLLADDATQYMNGDVATERGIARILHAGYVNQCLVDDTVPVLKEGQFLLYVEESSLGTADECIAAMACFSESAYLEKTIDNMNAAVDEAKKKLIGTKSNHSATENSD